MSLPKNYLDVHYEAEGRYRVWVFRNNQPRTQCYREHLFTVVLLAKRLNCAIRLAGGGTTTLFRLPSGERSVRWLMCRSCHPPQ